MTTFLIVFFSVLAYLMAGVPVGVGWFRALKAHAPRTTDVGSAMMMAVFFWPLGLPTLLAYSIGHRMVEADDAGLTRKQQRKLAYERELTRVSRERNDELERSNRLILVETKTR